MEPLQVGVLSYQEMVSAFLQTVLFFQIQVRFPPKVLFLEVFLSSTPVAVQQALPLRVR